MVPPPRSAHNPCVGRGEGGGNPIRPRATTTRSLREEEGEDPPQTVACAPRALHADKGGGGTPEAGRQGRGTP